MTTGSASLDDYCAREARDMTAACTACGRCVEVCPVLPYLGLEQPVPEAIAAGVVAFLRGQELPPAAAAWTRACHGCGLCLPACPEGLNPRKLLQLATIRLRAGKGEHAALFKKMSAAVMLMLRLQRPPADVVRLLRGRGKPTAPVVFHLGCNPLRTPHILLNAMEVLDALAVNYEVMGGTGVCCGIIHTRWMGELGHGAGVTETALAKFAHRAPQRVLCWCPSCLMHLGETLAGFRPPAFTLDHIATFWGEHLEQLRPLLIRPVPRRVVLHAHEGLTEISRHVVRLLQAIPGLTLLDAVFEPGYICGGSGCERCPAQREHEHQRLLRRAASLGAEVLVTLYHSCHAAFVPAEKTGAYQVRNFTDLLVEALGRTPHADGLKPLRLADDLAPLAEEGAAMLRQHGFTYEPPFLVAHLPELLTMAEFKGGLRCFD